MSDNLNLHSLNQVGECHTEEKGNKQSGDGVNAIPDTAPLLRLELRAPFNCTNANDECQQNEEECQVHSREHGCVPFGECCEGRATGGEQPDLVTVPVRADCA